MFTKDDVGPKYIKGRPVELTDEEKQAIADEWNANIPTIEDKRAEARLDRESFMLALKAAGLYGQAKKYANSLAEDHDWRIRWENSAMFNRTDPDLVAGAKDMGLTDKDLDAIFGVEQ